MFSANRKLCQAFFRFLFLDIGIAGRASFRTMGDVADLDPDIAIIAQILNDRALGKKKSDFAEALGIRPSAVTSMLAGTRRLQKDEVAAAEAFLGVLLPSSKREHLTTEPERVNLGHFPIGLAPVRGDAAAGVWLEFESFDDQRYPQVPYVPDDRYPNLLQFAFRVVGQSVDREKIFDGDFVVCVEAAPMPGDVVVIERRRGHLFERACKKYLLAPNGSAYVISSSTDERYRSDPITLGDDDGDADTQVVIVGKVIGSYRPRR